MTTFLRFTSGEGIGLYVLAASMIVDSYLNIGSCNGADLALYLPGETGAYFAQISATVGSANGMDERGGYPRQGEESAGN
ncbi:hypothetical protein [Paraburkholderia sp. DGU8]|uniref:hypothetical protein n=1 Tax=Paraburkholderia sp. DGU8 TaxID=3161997 RepID=UPI003466FB06